MTDVRPRPVGDSEGPVLLVSLVVFALCGLNADRSTSAGDWPQLGGSSTRNNVSPATGLPM
ncbi:MAG: hypothetical protein ACPLRM_01050, partial [Anaerolineae bacterium]